MTTFVLMCSLEGVDKFVSLVLIVSFGLLGFMAYQLW